MEEWLIGEGLEDLWRRCYDEDEGFKLWVEKFFETIVTVTDTRQSTNTNREHESIEKEGKSQKAFYI